MMDISILIPTIRNPSRVIDFFRQSACPLKYEILIGGPIKECGDADYALLVKEDLGSAWMMNKLYKMSSGRYIMCVCDDHIYTPNWWDWVEEIETMLDDKIYKVLSIPCGPPCPLPDWWGGPWELHGVKTGCKDCYITTRFPVFRRDTIDNYMDGIIFNESFKHHHVDIWLGHWLAETGEPSIESNKVKTIGLGHQVHCVHDHHDEATCHRLVQDFNAGICRSYSNLVDVGF
jgi:glycosyltransferase involved in cell wall biosynthesis